MKYTSVHLKFLRKNIKGRYMSELTALFNKRFRLSVDTDCLRSFCKRNGLKSNYHKAWNKKYFAEHINFLRKIVPGRRYSDVVELFNSHFGVTTNRDSLTSLIYKHGIKNGFPADFPKGHVPHNKGKKGVYYAGCEKTWFKKGSKPANWRPVGSERISSYGYIEVKYADRGGPPKQRWKGKHIMVWEKANGPVPKGHVVIFLDGNKTNCKLNNLMMLSRNEHARMCQMNFYTNNRKTAMANCMLAKSRVAVANLKKKTFKVVKNKKLIFLNNNKRKVYVIREKGRYIPVRETKDGSLCRLRVRKLKSRATRGEAQSDLREYAADRGWMRI